MKILAYAGSNSSTSINKQLARYAASLFENADVEVLDLNDFEMPLFGVDLEKKIGHHPLAQAFLEKISTADLIVLSLAENNGNYSAAFKNHFDWMSRIRKDVFQNKPMLLMATSDGGRGGKSVLEIAQSNLPRYGADIKGVFSLPVFKDNFDKENQRISNPEFVAELARVVNEVKAQL